jgi:tRNA wybutosine-synthesizing protein 4
VVDWRPSDPLPWQCLSRYPSACNGVKFVDVDYAELMLRKRAVIQNTYELHSLFTNYQQSTGDVLFHSDQYLQLGCDLRDLPRLEKALAGVVDFENSHFLFTAEVSITYMGSQESDALIKWASGLPQGLRLLSKSDMS